MNKKCICIVVLLLIVLFGCDLDDGAANDGEHNSGTGVTPGIDSDNDGLDDIIEVQGFSIFIETNGLGNYIERVVYSDPSQADTDGDGLLDGQERQYLCDPRNSDTDGDSLSDFDEIKLFRTAPNMVDTDMDSLGNPAFFDGVEKLVYGTSPSHFDTDGDGYSDQVEVLSPVPHKAIIADLPELLFSWSSNPNVTINKVETSTTTSSFTETNFTSSTTSTHQHTYNSVNTIESCNVDSSTKASWSARKGAKVEGTVNVNLYSQTNTFASQSFSLDTDNTNQNTMQQFLSGTETVTLSGGTMNMTLDITNTSEREVFLDSIEIGVFLVGDSGLYEDRLSICSLYPDSRLPIQLKSSNNSVSMNFRNDNINLENIRRALRSPERLRFEINNYSFSDSTNGGYNYPTIREAVSANDVLVSIDYSYGNGSESFLIAGNVNRNEQGEYTGISLQQIMDTIDRDFIVEVEDDMNILTSVAKDGDTVVTATEENGGLWIVILPPGVESDGVNFEDIHLYPGEGSNYVKLIYTENSDTDILWDFEDDDILNNRYFLDIGWHLFHFAGGIPSLPGNFHSVKMSMEINYRSDSNSLGPIPVFSDYEFKAEDYNPVGVNLPLVTPSLPYIRFWVTEKERNTFWIDTTLMLSIYSNDGTPPRYETIVSSQQWVNDPSSPNALSAGNWSRVIYPETNPGSLGMGRDSWGNHIHPIPGLTSFNVVFQEVLAVYTR